MKRVSLLAAVIFLGTPLIVSPQGQDDLARGLAGYWRFDEGEGDVIFDSSGNEHHGGAKNGPQWVEGKFGMALQFDGIDDVVEIPHADQLVKLDQITIALWVKLTGPPDQQGGKAIHGLVGKGGYSHGYRLAVRDSTKTVVFQLTGEKFTLESKGVLTAGQWHHIAATYDGSTMRLYVDGILEPKEKERQGPIDPNTVPLVIGRAQFASNAALDEVRIYNRALSPVEVQALYQYVPPPSFKKCDVVINKVAWSGTLASPAHEWIELYTATSPFVLGEPADEALLGDNGG